MDRDTKYSDVFRGIITRAGTNVVRLPGDIARDLRHPTVVWMRRDSTNVHGPGRDVGRESQGS
jgi:hypothetical protein